MPQRLTRSASRALSDKSAAPSRAGTPARSARGNTAAYSNYESTPSRAIRGRGRRSAATPATALEEEEVDGTPNQAYGTEGIGEVAPLEQTTEDELGTPGGLAAVSEEDEVDSLGSTSRASSSVSERLQSEPIIQKYSVRNVVKTKTTQLVPDLDSVHSTPGNDRTSLFTMWAPRLRQLNPIALLNQDNGLPEIESDARTHPRNAAFRPQQNLLSRISTPTFILTVLLLCALFSYIFDSLRRPALTPIMSGASNSTSDNTPNIAQQVLHTTSLHINRLEDRIATLEHQLKSSRKELPISPKREVNWFMPGFGASIDEFLTSPTAAICDPRWKPWPWDLFFPQSCPDAYLSGPPIMALQQWEDPGLDRWCAPRTPFGKLQITVQLDRAITPTELIVEHASKDVSPIGHMGTAPKEIEIWIQVKDDDVRMKAAVMIDSSYPELWRDTSRQGRELAIAQTLSFDYIPISRFVYNIHDKSETQAFQIMLPLSEYGVKTESVAVRVNSNWGDEDFTCLNRLSMHGVDASGIVRPLDDDVG